jgi:hypothetical protein
VGSRVALCRALLPTVCINLFDSLPPPPLTNAVDLPLLLLSGVYVAALISSLTYFAAMEWKDWLSRECSTSFLLVSAVCIDLYDSLSRPPLTNADDFSLLIWPGVYGAALILSLTYFAAMEWKDYQDSAARQESVAGTLLSRDCCYESLMNTLLPGLLLTLEYLGSVGTSLLSGVCCQDSIIREICCQYSVIKTLSRRLYYQDSTAEDSIIRSLL